MTLWILAAALALLAAAWLTRAFWLSGRTEQNETEHALSIYRDQQEELRRDHEAGLISESEMQAAQQEIERRTIKAARSLDAGLLVSRRSPLLAVVTACGVVAASLGLYAVVGSPEAEDLPLAARKAAILERQAEAGDLGSKAELLAEKIEDNPESFEDWWLLAKTYAAQGDYASAADAYRRAATLSEDDPAVLSAYAEALTLANGNKVPTAAKLIFAQARDKSNDPRARYYLALAKAQAQDFEGALRDWLALLADSTQEAPWTPLVRRDIVNMARFLELDLKTVLADATPAELATAEGAAGAVAETAAPRAQSGQGGDMAALEAHLAQDPKDWQGWIDLAGWRAARDDMDGAIAALDQARAQFSGAPFVLARIEEASTNLGLSVPSSPAGPSQADIAAAAEMSEADRDAMIRGMVDGLAARLEDQPNDLEGWLMLIRSYATLQDAPAAKSAVKKAREQFAQVPQDLRDIDALADQLGVTVN